MASNSFRRYILFHLLLNANNGCLFTKMLFGHLFQNWRDTLLSFWLALAYEHREPLSVFDV